jgi:L-ribulose-5-phosphate 3-epimerase
MNRRQSLQQLTLLAAASLTALPQLARAKNKPYQIGACDWSLGSTCSPAVFDYAREIGLDGVQLSYNKREDETYLLRPENQQAMREASKRTGVKIASLAIEIINSVPLKALENPQTVNWISGSIDAAKALGVKVVLLAFFSKNDLRNDPAGKKIVIERLKQVAPKAEAKGIILGIESYLTAKEHLEIIEAVGSPNVQVYYDPRNASDAGNDVYSEIILLGSKGLICEIHLKDNDNMLGQGSLDWPRIRRVLDEVQYRGWAQIEWSVPKGKTIKECYPDNVKYARGVFGQ